jgi:hypothetical protein
MLESHGGLRIPNVWRRPLLNCRLVGLLTTDN